MKLRCDAVEFLRGGRGLIVKIIIRIVLVIIVIIAIIVIIVIE